ncbi:MAG: hypothetical protein Q8Q33_08395, partial [Chlamydiota bacterium]|nr:hypothetical protein [Chlamydiota bacterium]
NLLQAVDNLGTVYRGTVTENISTLSVTQANTFVTVSATMQGTDRGGKVITITFTHVNAVGFIFPAYALDTTATGLDVSVSVDTVKVDAVPSQQTNIASDEIFIQSMFGTYMDSTNLSGSFEMINNTVQSDVVL